MSSSTKSFGLYLLIVICVICQSAGGGTSTYVFLSEHSKAVKVGGIAGVHETYPIQGQFQLTVDANAGVASFDYVDAFLLSPISSSPPQSLGELFNMTELQGNIVDDTTIAFVGKTADGTESDILITLSFRDDSAHLAGRTVPPPDSADFFIYELDAAALKKYGGGTGEPNEPYLIYTAEQMNNIGLHEEDWDKHFRLMVDIDLSIYGGTDFNIIGYGRADDSPDNEPFTGVLDGNGHTISNFSYTSADANYIGLFGSVDGPNAQVRELGVIDPNVNIGASGIYAGTLVGWFGEGTISDCYSRGGTISGGVTIGGLIGMSHGTISDCYSSTAVFGTGGAVGGLVGRHKGDLMSNCHSSGNVVAGGSAGGLVGWTDPWGGDNLIENCYAIGDVEGGDDVGGLVGANGCIISSCCATGNITFIGDSLSEPGAGGLAGRNIGGIIRNCYSAGNVAGGGTLGGLVGINETYWGFGGTITTCYSLGSVTGTNKVGGLVGSNKRDGTIHDNCFWNVETSGQVSSVRGTGKTTAEMQTRSTFTDAGWDFVGESANGTEDIWSICDGTNYPRLAWQIPAGDFVCPDGISIEDFVFFIERWQDDNCDSSNDYCDGTDLDRSGRVDAGDLEILVDNWLAEVRSD